MRSPMSLVGTAVFVAVFMGLAGQAVRMARDAPEKAAGLDVQVAAAVLADGLLSRPGVGWWTGAPDCDGWQGLEPGTVRDLGLGEDTDCMGRWAPGATQVLSYAKVLSLGAPVEGIRVTPLAYAQARTAIGVAASGLQFHIHAEGGAPTAEATPFVVEFGPGVPTTGPQGTTTRLATLWDPVAGPSDVRVTVNVWTTA